MKGVWRRPQLPAGWTHSPITSEGITMSAGGRWRVTGGPGKLWKAQRWSWGESDDGWSNDYETAFEAEDFTTVYVWMQIEGVLPEGGFDVYADFAKSMAGGPPGMSGRQARQVGKSAMLGMRYGMSSTGRMLQGAAPQMQQLPKLFSGAIGSIQGVNVVHKFKAAKPRQLLHGVVDEANMTSDQIDALRAYCSADVEHRRLFDTSLWVDGSRPLNSFLPGSLAHGIRLAITCK